MQAPTTPITGLDRIPFDPDALTSAHLDDLQDRLTEQMPSLRIEFVDPPTAESMRTGQPLTLRLRGVPLPEIDLARGQLAATTRREDMPPILVEFEGIDAPVVAIGTFDRRTSLLAVDVPHDAVSGPVVVQVPVRRRFGRQDPRMRRRLAELLSDCTPREYERAPDALWSYLRYFAGVGTLVCGRCVTDPICPHGAIRFDPAGNCYVDKNVCIGQSRQVETQNVGGTLRRVVTDETSCWDCFDGAEELSKKCNHRRVGRVVHMGPFCCGSCIETATKIPNVCLRELCNYGAITGGHSTATRCGNQLTFSGLGGPYQVDPDVCVGCQTCYDNIVCATPMMKAHVRGRLAATLSVDRIRPARPGLGFPIAIEVSGRNADEVFHLRYEFGAGDVVIRPSEFDESEISFVDALYIVAVRDAERAAGSPLVLARPRLQKRVIRLRNIVGPTIQRTYTGTLSFFDQITIDYTLKDVAST